MENIFKKLGVLVLFMAITLSCDMDGDLKNPNEASVEQADPQLIMNSIQLDFADFYSLASGNTVLTDKTTVGVDRLMRMRAMITGYRYQTAFQPQFMDDLWRTAYQRVLTNIETLLPMAEEKEFTTLIGVAKILKAYTYLTLVDLFGDVPQSEALLGLAEFNPSADNGSAIYTQAITLLGEARTELAKKGLVPGDEIARDIYYDVDGKHDSARIRARWTALANTLELKAWVNLSMIPARKAEADAKIATFFDLASGDSKPTVDIIDTEAENFTYKYGTATVPVSRHPIYRQYYGPAKGSATGYICNSYLAEVYSGLGVEDPRWRYYFYRQVGSLVRAAQVDPKSIGCNPAARPARYTAGNYVFCTFEPGFYGRDHGDASGTPADTQVITCAGSYPAAGRADITPTSVSTYFGETQQGQGGNGAGIEPMYMSFFTDFLKAEVMARAGQAAAGAVLERAVRASVDQVRSFSNSVGEVLPAGLEPDVDDYVTAVGNKWSGAATNADKVKVVGRELYVACWGSAIEAYNAYRRTSAPTHMQPTVQVGEGLWLRSLVYPANFVNLNNTAAQKDFGTTNKVFWDNNPDELN